MPVWKDFEAECLDFLKARFGDEVGFSLVGGSNSKVSDIKVEKNGKIFYIEAKKCPAQCGQFVLTPNVLNRRFEYSPKNKTPYCESTKTIIEHMNRNFDIFSHAETTGKVISFKNCEECFIRWIQQMYMTKQTKFFITNRYAIFPIEDIGKFFDISAQYRIKRSGSAKIGIKSIPPIKKYITENCSSVTIFEKDGRLCYTGDDKIINKKFTYCGNEYYFSQNQEIRKLSNTFHANVIFAVTLRDDQANGLNEDEIKRRINSFLL